MEIIIANISENILVNMHRHFQKMNCQTLPPTFLANMMANIKLRMSVLLEIISANISGTTFAIITENHISRTSVANSSGNQNCKQKEEGKYIIWISESYN